MAILLGSAIALWSVPAATRPGPVERVAADLEGEGVPARVEFRRGARQAVSVWQGARRVWTGVPARWNAWKVRIGDVDGDGRDEIVIGVHKATRYAPTPHNGLFVMAWDGRQVYPKWLGSSLARPFSDFDLEDVDGDGLDEVVAVETTRDGDRSIGVYSWRGFGFAVDAVRGTAEGEESDAQ